MILYISNEFDVFGIKIKFIIICNVKWNEEFKYFGRNLVYVFISYLDWMFLRGCIVLLEI